MGQALSSAIFRAVKRPTFLLFVLITLAFGAGLLIGRYSIPVTSGLASRPARLTSDSLGEGAGARLIAPPATIPPRPAEQSNGTTAPGPASIATVIASLQNAMAHPSDRHGYLEASKLIDGIDPENIREVIAEFQRLPEQREKSIYLALLVSHWAESDPQAAVAYAQATGSASDRTLAVASAVRAVMD